MRTQIVKLQVARGSGSRSDCKLGRAIVAAVLGSMFLTVFSSSACADPVRLFVKRPTLEQNKSGRSLLALGKTKIGALQRASFQLPIEGRLMTARILNRSTIQEAGIKATRLSGKIEGVRVSNSLSLTQVGNGFYGTARVGEKIFLLRGESDTGLTRIEEMSIDEPAACGVQEDAQPAAEPSSHVSNTNSGLPAPGNGLTHIDVLFVYTASTTRAAGGQHSVEATIMEALFGSNTGTNSILDSSGIPVFVRPISVRALPDNEDETGNATRDLEDLVYVGGAYSKWDNVPVLRDQAKADLVQLVVSKAFSGANSICGTSIQRRQWNNTGEGYGLTKLSCTAAQLTLAHELGHSLGAHHENSSGYFDFSRGYVFNVGNTQYGTIMAQNLSSRTRVPLYSSPNLNYAGSAVGTAANDNKTTITLVAPLVASYRVPVCLGDFNDDRSIDNSDLSLLLNSFGQASASDMDGDGVITTQDLTQLLSRLGKSCSDSV